MAAECTQQAQQRMKYYYDQDAKAHPFEVGHKVWIYYLADKQGLSKKLCSLWYDAFGLVDQFTPVSIRLGYQSSRKVTEKLSTHKPNKTILCI